MTTVTILPLRQRRTYSPAQLAKGETTPVLTEIKSWDNRTKEHPCFFDEDEPDGDVVASR